MIPNYLPELARLFPDLRVVMADGRRAPITSLRSEQDYKEAVYLYVPRSSKLIRLPKEVDRDYAYLLGSLRDATAYAPEYEVKFVQASEAWLRSSVLPRLSKVFGLTGLRVRRRKDGLFTLKVNSKALLAILVVHAGITEQCMPTPAVMRYAGLMAWRYYVAGFYDAEGDKTGQRLRIWQSWHREDKCPPLEDISRILARLGITSSLYRMRRCRSGLYEFCLEIKARPQGNKEKFLALIPLEHPGIGRPREFRRA